MTTRYPSRLRSKKTARRRANNVKKAVEKKILFNYTCSDDRQVN